MGSEMCIRDSIVRDDVTKVTLFDYSDIIADEKPVYPQKQTSEE